MKTLSKALGRASLLVAVAIAALPATAAEQPWTGSPGIRETVAQIQARAATGFWRPGYGFVFRKMREKEGPDRQNLLPNPLALPGMSWPPSPSSPIRPGVRRSPQSLSTNWTGDTWTAAYQIYPPDTMGAVGPTQVLVTTNSRIRVFDKNGTVGALDVNINDFFATVRTAGQTAFDPRAHYDRLSGRFFIVAIDGANVNRILVAVSSGSTITNQSSFTFFQFRHDQAAPAGDAGLFADYPSLGVDANALYVGVNCFGANFVNSTVHVIRKSSVLGTGPIVVRALRNIIGATAGGFAPMGVSSDNPAQSVGYVIGVDAYVFSRLSLYRISDPGGTPTISAPISINVNTTSFPPEMPQSGTAVRLDTVDDRLFNAEIKLNRKTGNWTLLTSHNINQGGRAASRFYEIGSLDTTPAVLQSGTLTSTTEHYGIPSVTRTGQGHLVMGFTRASSSIFAGAAFAGRLHSDTAGLLQAPTVIVNGAARYTPLTNPAGTGVERWGDYSATMTDPADDQTVWTIQEFVSATDTWAVRVARLLAPPPAAISTVSPNALIQGATNQNITITGTSTSGSEFYDTDSSYSQRLAASFGAGVTVNSVTFNSPTQMTVNVSVAGNAATGGRTLTVTNPDGQQATLANALTINPSTVVLVPDAFSFFRGSLDSGNLASLAAVDANRLVGRPGFTLNPTEAPCQLVVESTAPGTAVSQLQFRFNMQANTGGLTQTLQVFDWTTNAYVNAGTQTLSTSNVSVTTNITNPANFIRASDRKVRARLQVRVTGFTTTSAWRPRWDEAVWFYTP